MEGKIYTQRELTEQLSTLTEKRDGIVLMHSSLRLIGRVEGGAEGLLNCLIEYFTAEGGLFCIPTHTWAFMKREITLDFQNPETCLGALSELAARDPRGIRSENPTHSMTVYGDRERAEEFVRGEIDCTSGTAPESCYGRIYREGGSILLAGVAQNRNTYLHCVEEMLGVTNRLSEEPKHVVIRRADGTTVERMVHGHHTDFTSDVSLRFVKYETAFRYHRAITDGFLGDAPTQFCDARKMYDTMALIRERTEGTDPLSDEKIIPPTAYYLK